MKKILIYLIALIMCLFSAQAIAEEFYEPVRDGAGVIGGRHNEAWRLGIYETLRLHGVSYVFPAADGTNGQSLVTDGAGTFSWASAANTAWDDLSVPDANESLDHTVYYTEWDFGDADHDMFTLYFTEAFGDVSGMVLEQKTGDPTNGTIFEIKMADTDPDFLSFATGGVEKVNIADNGDLTLSAGDISCVDVAGSGNLSIGGTWSVDSIAAATATQKLTLDGDTTGGVDVGVTSTGDITLGDTTVVSDGYNLTIGEGSLIVDNDATDENALSITSDATTSGTAVTIISAATTGGKGISLTADGLTTGDMLYLDSTVAGLTTGNYIHCYDGAATDLEVGKYGATTIAGNASTDVLILTAGDMQLTAGDIDLDNGQLMVDTVQDLANNVNRNYNGVGTSPVLTVKEDHTSSTNVALLVENDGTGASTALQISHDGDSPAIDIDAGAARTGDVVDIAMANQLAERAINITGAATSATDEGVIEVHTTGNMAGALLRLDIDTGTPAAIDGYVLEIDDDSGAQAGKYAVEINSENNDALYVSKGLCKFTEATTHTGGIDIDEDMDIDFNAADEEVIISNSEEYGADDAQVMIDNTHADITANAYLLRLRYTDDADPDADFLVCEDNAGDDQLAINAVGDIVMGGATGTGGKLVTSFEDLTIDTAGTAASIVVYTTFITTDGDGNEDNATLANGTKGQMKIFVSAVEGAGGDSYKITPASLNGGSKITFDGVVGDGCTMMYDGSAWNIISNNGGTIS